MEWMDWTKAGRGGVGCGCLEIGRGGDEEAGGMGGGEGGGGDIISTPICFSLPAVTQGYLPTSPPDRPNPTTVSRSGRRWM